MKGLRMLIHKQHNIQGKKTYRTVVGKSSMNVMTSQSPLNQHGVLQNYEYPWIKLLLLCTLLYWFPVYFLGVMLPPPHRGKSESGPMVSRPNNVSTVFNISQWDTKILRVSEISDEGFMVNQYLKRVTKPKFELQPHLALQQDIFSETAFYT